MVLFDEGTDMPGISPYRLTLTDAERTELEARARRYTSPFWEVMRAKIVLYAAEGLGRVSRMGRR